MAIVPQLQDDSHCRVVDVPGVPGGLCSKRRDEESVFIEKGDPMRELSVVP